MLTQHSAKQTLIAQLIFVKKVSPSKKEQISIPDGAVSHTFQQQTCFKTNSTKINIQNNPEDIDNWELLNSVD